MCPLPDDPTQIISSSTAQPDEFSSEERVLLLQLAHESIAATLERREISLIPPTAHLAKPRGAFTCPLRLRRHGIFCTPDDRDLVG